MGTERKVVKGVADRSTDASRPRSQPHRRDYS
jgi:hypothetical protein